ncbi:MFS transporter [Streptomyces mirabilis]|uniref:MFS transporter n=1 Tax=Streptomyces mirabilis TaxID=68239 RepID=UPI00332494A2
MADQEPAVGMLPGPESGGTQAGSVGGLVPLGWFGAVLLMLSAGWALPSTASGTLLQALLAQQRGAAKGDWLAVVGSVGAVSAVASTVIAGAWSDRTRSRRGRRYPWILGGATVGGLGLTLTGATAWIPAQVLGFALFQGGMNALVAAAAALVPDRVAPGSLGRASAWSAAGYLLGSSLGGVIASGLVGSPGVGLMLVPWTMLAATALLVLTVPAVPSLEPRAAVSSTEFRSLLSSLRPPRDRDFLLAFGGRFLVILGLTVLVFYQLYIFTDFLGLDTEQAARQIARGTVLLGMTALLTTWVGGLAIDRTGRCRPLVVGASLLVAGSAVPAAVAPGIGSLTVFYVLTGAGFGLYLSADQALMVKVLPTAGAEAKELGMLSIANSAPSLVAPVVAAMTAKYLGFHALFVFTVIVALLGGGCVGAIRRVR